MKVTVGKIKKRKIILLNFVILLFVVWWLGVFFIMYKHFYERIMFGLEVVAFSFWCSYYYIINNL